jgi:hypothetical protein
MMRAALFMLFVGLNYCLPVWQRNDSCLEGGLPMGRDGTPAKDAPEAH